MEPFIMVLEEGCSRRPGFLAVAILAQPRYIV